MGWFASAIYPGEPPASDTNEDKANTVSKKEAFLSAVTKVKAPKRVKKGSRAKTSPGASTGKKTGKGKEGLPVAYVAALNEYGYPGRIPERPFIRPTVAENKDEWRRIMGLLAHRVLNGKMSSEDAMNVFGLRVAGEIRKTISNLWEPKLSELTIQIRLEQRADKKTVGQLNKPLVFEGILKNSVSYIVKGGNEVRPFPGGA